MVPRPAAPATLGNLLEMHVLGPQPRPTESETLGVELGNLFSQALQVILMQTEVWESSKVEVTKILL